ncbi:MAG: hypothetical protein HW391_1912, partial [Chloroflexi bacterium]|nr:hypothetical protein [Chloroflexota bacterium]
PILIDGRPVAAARLMDTVRPAGFRGSTAPRTGGGPFVAVFAGG